MEIEAGVKLVKGSIKAEVKVKVGTQVEVKQVSRL